MKKILLIVFLLISIIVIGLVMDRYSVTSIKERAEQGHVEAQFNLGVYYYNVDDYIEAFKWFSIAISGGSRIKIEDLEVIEELENVLKDLTSKMTGAQISEAMRRTTEWVKSHGGGEK